MRLKAIREKPGFERRFVLLEASSLRAWDRLWRAIREDAAFKSNMRIEGTAGELAARRNHHATG